MRIIALVFLMATVTFASVGCVSRQAEFAALPLQPVAEDGFQFGIQFIITSATISEKSSELRRGMTISAKCVDIVGNRTVAFAKSFELDEVRDEQGHDLLAHTTLISNNRPFAQETDDFESFSEPNSMRYGEVNHSETHCSVAINGLRTLPKRLSVLRGHHRVIVATDLSTHLISAKVSEGWMTIAPGLQLRIDSIAKDASWPQLHVLTRTELNRDELDEVQYQRWYWVESFDDSGALRGSGRAYPRLIQDGIGQWTHTLLSQTLPDQFPTVLKLTVIGDMHVVRIPFEYHDIPLQ